MEGRSDFDFQHGTSGESESESGSIGEDLRDAIQAHLYFTTSYSKSPADNDKPGTSPVVMAINKGKEQKRKKRRSAGVEPPTPIKIDSSSTTDDVIVIESTKDIITISDTESDMSSLHYESLERAGQEGEEPGTAMELCSGDELEVGGVGDDWAVCEKDRLGRDVYERRYGDRPGRYYNKGSGKCSNCRQIGHTQKSCPWPKRHQVCHFCSLVGHISSRCPTAMCSYCFQTSHKGRRCSGPCGRPVDCTRCYMPGHIAAICPDQWRQFHNTNYSHEVLVAVDPAHQRKPHKVYCYNCAAIGHYGFECVRPRPRGCFRPFTPLIAHYDHHGWPPRDFPQIRQRLGMPPPTSHHRGNSRKRPPLFSTPPPAKHGRRSHDQSTERRYSMGRSHEAHRSHDYPRHHPTQSHDYPRRHMTQAHEYSRRQSYDFPRTYSSSQTDYRRKSHDYDSRSHEPYSGRSGDVSERGFRAGPHNRSHSRNYYNRY